MKKSPCCWLMVCLKSGTGCCAGGKWELQCIFLCLYVKLKAMRDFTKGNFWSHLCIMIGYLILNGLTGFRETIQDAVLRKKYWWLRSQKQHWKERIGLWIWDIPWSKQARLISEKVLWRGIYPFKKNYVAISLCTYIGKKCTETVYLVLDFKAVQ